MIRVSRFWKLACLVVALPALAHGAGHTISATARFDAATYRPEMRPSVTLELGEDVDTDDMRVMLFFYLSSDAGRATGHFTADTEVKAYVRDVNDNQSVPLTILSRRQWRISDVPLSRWLPAGDYALSSIGVVLEDKKTHARTSLGRIELPWFDASGTRIRSVAPAFQLAGTDPDDINPVIDGISFRSGNWVRRGEQMVVKVRYSDNKSGLRRLGGFLLPVEKYEVGYAPLAADDLGLQFACDYAGLPLTGEVECPIPDSGTLSPGLYAVHFMMISDQRGWGLDSELIYSARLYSPAARATKMTGGAVGGGTTHSAQYWKDHGHALSFALPVIEVR